MRAYGIPQADFALESFMDDMALKLNMDPVDLRLKNCMREGYEDPVTKIRANSDGLYQCLQKGREVFHWDELRKKYANQTGSVRRGVGVACFNYKTGVYPISLETASARAGRRAECKLRWGHGNRAGRRYGVLPDGCRSAFAADG